MMHKYDLMASEDFRQFEFISTGPNGDIAKLIQFTPTENRLVFFLSFGNKIAEGEADYSTVSNNRDRDKILNTVIDAIDLFTKEYPFFFVGFQGTTPARSRLYRTVISLKFNELSRDYKIWGIDLHHSHKMQKFKPGNDYDIFIIKRNNSKFEP